MFPNGVWLSDVSCHLSPSICFPLCFGVSGSLDASIYLITFVCFLVPPSRRQGSKVGDKLGDTVRTRETQ